MRGACAERSAPWRCRKSFRSAGGRLQAKPSAKWQVALAAPCDSPTWPDRELVPSGSPPWSPGAWLPGSAQRAAPDGPSLEQLRA
jgi:hypothetical protein